MPGNSARSADTRRRELGDFLRARRNRLVRSEFDLPEIGRSKSHGLRREEIAYLAGVSITWYTWLEQGRSINPSRAVLDSLAATLRLTEAEHEYLLGLAGYLAPRRVPESSTPGPSPAALPGHLQRLLDALPLAPSFAISPDWMITGWNRAYEVLYPSISRTPAADRNLLAAVFTDPYVRAMLPDWEVTSQQFLAEYRADAGRLLSAPGQAALVSRLREASEHFSASWDQHRVTRFTSRQRRFAPPGVGELVFEQDQVNPSDLPDVTLVIYLPADQTTEERLAEALAR